MAKPVRPVAPPRALRSDPATFSANAEGEITYQFDTLPNWMNALADFTDDRADDALAAALAGDLPPITGRAGNFLRVKFDETGAEFLNGDNLTAVAGLTTPGLVAVDGLGGASAVQGFVLRGGPVIRTTSGAYTPDAAVRAIRMQVWGAGGAGGGATTTAGRTAIAGGGGAGGYAERFDTSLAASYTITIGAGGVGVNGSNGGNGGTSSITASGVTTLSASGGRGGPGRTMTSGTALLNAEGGSGGLGSGGSINLRGARGGSGMASGAVTSIGPFNQPDGASAPVLNCGGGEGVTHSGSQDQRNDGGSAGGFAAGGGGAGVTNAGVSRAGGSGSNGLVLIWEYV